MKIKIREQDGTYTPVLVFIALILFTISVFLVKKIAMLVGVFIFLYAFLKILKNRNADGKVHLFVAFFVGSEVFWRMTYSGLPWEFSKLSILILLGTALAVEISNRKKPYIFLFYILLFIPAIFVPEFVDIAEYRKRVTFNLLGEFILAISVFYFYNRKLTNIDLANLSKWIIYGLFLMSVMVILKSPSYDTIEYGRQSSYAASGGFGPNQVAVMFGIGILMLGYSIIKNITLFKYKIIDYSLLLLFSFQLLFTLSRGGLMAAGLALFFGLFVLFFTKPIILIIFLKKNFIKLFLVVFFSIFAFIQADEITNGAISKRYFNKNEYGEQIRQNYTSYRDHIVKADIIIFFENIELGVGPGQSMIHRMKYLGGEIHAAHVEYSRMLSEHGILGLIALFLMFFIPILRFFSIKNFDTKLAFVIFVSFALLTMSHNAMRVSAAGFFYGLGFILIITEIKKNKLKEKLK